MAARMLKGPGLKATLTMLLVGAAAFASSSPSGGQRHIEASMIISVLLFGIINVFLAVPGAASLRFFAIAAAVATLLWPQYLGVFAPLIALIVWPAWILIAWAVSLAQVAGDDVVDDEDANDRTRTDLRPRVPAAALVVATAAGASAYHWVRHHHLDQSGALFIGIPALLSLLVIFMASPRSAAGVACKVVTIGLLMSMMFLWEGALCVVMSAPLFYAIAILIGGTVDYARRKGARSSTLSCLLLVVLVPMSLEGVTEKTSLSRDQWVTQSRLVHASSADIARALVAAPRFDRPLPLYLRAGFPRAMGVRIEPTATGAKWLITVKGGEMKLNGMEARAGTLVLQVEESRPGLIHWRVLSDDSHMTHFLRWREARVEWKAVAGGATEVTWSLRYDRGLDPAWYFGPWERYAARLGAGYLIDALATP